MRRLTLLLPIVATLSSCGKPAVALPEDPVQLAATCGVIAAAAIDKQSTVAGTRMGVADSGRILHYALLAGAKGGSFTNDAAAAVVDAMPTLQHDVTRAKWDTLVAPCNEAFPAAAPGKQPVLPDDALQAQLGCSALGTWLSKALAAKESDYGADLTRYRRFGTDIEPAVVTKLKARGSTSDNAVKAERDKAMAAIVEAGSPVPVMNACIAKFDQSL